MPSQELVKREKQGAVAHVFPHVPDSHAALSITGRSGTQFAYIGPDGSETTRAAFRLAINIAKYD